VTHEIVRVLFMSRLQIVSGLTLKDVYSSHETHTFPPPHKKHFCVESVPSRIETGRRRTAECRNTSFVRLSFSWMIPELNFVNRLRISKLLMSMKTDVRGPYTHCLSLPFQLMCFQYSQSGIVCVFRVSHRNCTTFLRVEILPAIVHGGER